MQDPPEGREGGREGGIFISTPAFPYKPFSPCSIRGALFRRFDVGAP